MQLRVGSVCTGIGGLDRGLEAAGMCIVWQIEINPYCRRVLAKHWSGPDVKRLCDVRDCGAHNLERVDVVCGGIPCQLASVAGKRLGAADDRWLWPEFYRIIREIRPRWVLVENVPGLLSVDAGRLFGGILRDLAAIGYDAEWECIPASAFGAHFRGERVYVVASRAAPCCLRRKGEWANPSRAFSEHEFARLVERELRLCVSAGKGDRVSDGVRGRVDRLRGLGNAVVPQVVEFVGRMMLRARRNDGESV